MVSHQVATEAVPAGQRKGVKVGKLSLLHGCTLLCLLPALMQLLAGQEAFGGYTPAMKQQLCQCAPGGQQLCPTKCRGVPARGPAGAKSQVKA